MGLLYRLLIEEKFAADMVEKFIYGIDDYYYKKMNIKLHINEKNTEHAYPILKLIKEKRPWVNISKIIDNTTMNDEFEKWYENNQMGEASDDGKQVYDKIQENLEDNEGYQEESYRPPTIDKYQQYKD